MGEVINLVKLTFPDGTILEGEPEEVVKMLKTMTELLSQFKTPAQEEEEIETKKKRSSVI